MESLKSFKDKLYSIRDDTFEAAALSLFRYQAVNNEHYARYIYEIGVDRAKISKVEDIPFLPIQFFKHFAIKTGEWKEDEVFLSSGTTGMDRSRHYVEDLSYYHSISDRIFRLFYGDPSGYVILALLPSYLEQNHSSLVSMANRLINLSSSVESGFHLHNTSELAENLQRLQKDKQKRILLFGVTYALLDLAENNNLDLHNVIIMETGGMKGRREELIRSQVHEILCSRFHVPSIHSEYGMTELLSQAYSKGDGLYQTPPWMRVYVREINDPFTIGDHRSHGVINVIDLANIHSCAFIATEDLGVVRDRNTFEILGRMDNSDTRGCNLLLN